MPKRNTTQISNTKFSQKKVELSDTPLFFPQGYENIFLLIYAVLLPYIAGLLFLFFYISKTNIEIFTTVYQNSFFILTWAMGYEIFAGIALLWIIKMAIGFEREKVPYAQKQFRIP